MKHILWFILFFIVCIFNFFREQQYVLIYYTNWTFILETIYFGLCIPKHPKTSNWARTLWPFIYAPSIVVCIGFWVIVAPIHFTIQKPTNMFLTVVTHGFNMIAMIMEGNQIFMKDVWKPVLYTFIYNIFLAIYVGAGGRSISNHLPYWYAQYDIALGWIFFALAISAVVIVHFAFSSSKRKTTNSKLYIV